MSGGAVWGVSVKGVLCPVGLCPGGGAGSLFRGSSYWNAFLFLNLSDHPKPIQEVTTKV